MRVEPVGRPGCCLGYSATSSQASASALISEAMTYGPMVSGSLVFGVPGAALSDVICSLCTLDPTREHWYAHSPLAAVPFGVVSCCLQIEIICLEVCKSS